MSYHEKIVIGEKDEVIIGIPKDKKLVFFARTKSGQPKKDLVIFADDANSVFQKGKGSIVIIMGVPSKMEDVEAMKNCFSHIENSGRCQGEDRWFIHGKGFAIHKRGGICYLAEVPLDVYRDLSPQ